LTFFGSNPHLTPNRCPHLAFRQAEVRWIHQHQVRDSRRLNIRHKHQTSRHLENRLHPSNLFIHPTCNHPTTNPLANSLRIFKMSSNNSNRRRIVPLFFDAFHSPSSSGTSSTPSERMERDFQDENPPTRPSILSATTLPSPAHFRLLGPRSRRRQQELRSSRASAPSRMMVWTHRRTRWLVGLWPTH
jgi:hypothetical protein